MMMEEVGPVDRWIQLCFVFRMHVSLHGIYL